MRTSQTLIIDGNRYRLDFGPCHFNQGYAQVDTTEDAWYYGTWANPTTLTIVVYAEGDLIIHECESEDEFFSWLTDFAKNECFRGIDPMCQPDIEERFKAIGLGSLLHPFSRSNLKIGADA